MNVQCAHTELVDIDLLVPNPLNPNKHPDSQIKLLAKIMAHQGWRSPIVVSNLSGFITKGHGRLMAAKLNGWTQAPVDRQDYANNADEYADMVADNKIAELSETDLAMVNRDVMDLGPDFDLELLGIPDFKVDPAELPDLPTGERAPFRQMTFTLHDDQAVEVERALKAAKAIGDFDSENENSNGNALARICETYLSDHGDS